ncbi:MAG TPA: nucleotidyltransferase family protein [Candidatus Acidoferrum sp.]|nr:nucleotidyltransferase family protein [Candidatus Acidoferrum sp.]
MKAMILAAGLGTRLRPLTDTLPKALVEINGRTLLEITLTRLRTFGVNEVVINVHHFAEMVLDYLQSHNNLGMRIEISREDDLLLDTGGGLKKASWFFLESARDSVPEPFVVHNVDVISTIDLHPMLQFHNEHGALATLAVQSRESSRLLLFDDQLQLCGRAAHGPSVNSPLAPRPSPLPLAFSGIHIISPRLLPMLTEVGVFSIIDAYLRLAGQGEKILAFRADEYYWRDLGRPADLSQAALDLQQRKIL